MYLEKTKHFDYLWLLLYGGGVYSKHTFTSPTLHKCFQPLEGLWKYTWFGSIDKPMACDACNWIVTGEVRKCSPSDVQVFLLLKSVLLCTGAKHGFSLGLVSWLQQQTALPPSLMTWVQSLRSTPWEELLILTSLSFDLYRCVTACICMYVCMHKRTSPYTQRQINLMFESTWNVK